MKIAICQYDIQWMQPTANIRKIASLINTYGQLDLIVLPEMALTGFNMNAQEASISENGSAIKQLIQLCKNHDTTIVGSFAIVEKETYFNRVLLLSSDGIIGRYDKQYLFSPSGEDKVFSSKYSECAFTFKGVNIITQVCYDLRFPESIRFTTIPDIIIYMANWPAPRIHHWNILLRARAIENQSFLIGCNRIGIDENGWEFPGHSQVISPNGTVLKKIEGENAFVIDIDSAKVAKYREKYPFIFDKKFPKS